MKRILIVDDDAGTRTSLRTLLEPEYQVVLCPDSAQAMRMLGEQVFDLVLLDVIMPHKDGLTLLREIREDHPHLPVIMISASTRVRPVVESMQMGAVDFVTKPFDVRELRNLVARTLEQTRLRDRMRAMESELSRQFPMEGLIGTSAAFRNMMDTARQLAGADSPLLLWGEPGVGKELVARQIHAWSDRSGEPFVVMPCGGTHPEMLEQELFGGGLEPGRLELAARGTLYLDGVEHLPAAVQSLLLEMLHSGEFQRAGEQRRLPCGARILAATSADLSSLAREGAFNGGLAGLLSADSLECPPLRRRIADIPMLAGFFLRYFRENLNRPPGYLSPEARTGLKAYPWPGNIRELRNLMERVVVLHGNEEVVRAEHLPPDLRPPAKAVAAPARPAPHPAGLTDSVHDMERQLLIDALKACNGVQTRAARQLGITRRVLKYKMDKLNISPPFDP